MVFDFVAASDFFDHRGKHVFSDVDEIVVICIGHVELAGSVLRVMGLIDGFISEIFAYFEHSL